METGTKTLIVALAVLGAVACQTVPPAAAPIEEGAVDVRKTMIDGINPAALAIWDVGNEAIDDDGAPDPSKLDAAALARVREGARTLEDYARRLAEAPVLTASGPDLVGGVVPEGVASREQIQAAIDTDPEGFRAHARAMGAEAKTILVALEANDRAKVAQLVTGFDGACQSCHAGYWYVTQ